MLELIRKSFELSVRMRWLKEINKVVKKRDKLYEQYKRQCYVAEELYKEFCKKYPNEIKKEK